MGRLGAKLGALLLGALALPLAANAADLGRPKPPALPSLSSVVERVMPAVVNISVSVHPADLETPDDALLKRLLPPPDGGHDGAAREGSSERRHAPSLRHNVTALGSGFIVDPQGYVVTNDHLIVDADRITVITRDNVRHEARVVGQDDESDIAVLKIAAPAPLPYVRWADSDRAKVGDWVVAVGNPFGLGGTVTAGIISARGRDIDDGPYDDFLQIDAPINRGNSGGPTFNLDGEVLGINTAIYTPSGGSIGIGFAIPATFASRIVAQLITRGQVDHGWLGVSTQNLTPAIAPSFDIDPADPVGALVDDVVHDGPAARAGLRQGDVILGVNGQPVAAAHDLRRLVDQAAIGQRVSLAVRRDGHDHTLGVIVASAPAPATFVAAAAETAGEGSSEPPEASLGLDLTGLTPELRRQLDLAHAQEGVYVAGVSGESPAAALGLEPGDVIVQVSRRKVASADEATRRLNEAIASGQVLVLVNRHGASHFLGATREHNQLVSSP